MAASASPSWHGDHFGDAFARDKVKHLLLTECQPSEAGMPFPSEDETLPIRNERDDRVIPVEVESDNVFNPRRFNHWSTPLPRQTPPATNTLFHRAIKGPNKSASWLLSTAPRFARDCGETAA